MFMQTSLRRLIAAAIVALATIGVVDAQDAQTLYVVTYLEAVPASQGQVATLLKQVADASRKEGAVRYEVLQRMTEPSHFVILEIWKDKPARDAHGGAPHTRQFREQVAPLLLAPLDERLCVATTVAPVREGRGAVYVVTHVDVPPGGRDATVASLKALAEQSRMDPGNLRFDTMHQTDRTNHFTVVDVWADQRSGEKHQVAPHTRTFRAQLAPFLGALYDQRWYKPL
jgi:autoinducer 2-degrading protein